MTIKFKSIHHKSPPHKFRDVSHSSLHSLEVGGLYDITKIITKNSLGHTLAIYTIEITRGGQKIKLEAPIPFKNYFYTRTQMRDIRISSTLCDAEF